MVQAHEISEHDNRDQIMGRKSISPSVREIVLIEAGHKCANPTCRHILTLELHHIVWVKDQGGDDPDNLLALCPNCHSLHTQGHISEKSSSQVGCVKRTIWPDRHGFFGGAAFDPTGPVPVESRFGNYTRRFRPLPVIPGGQWGGKCRV